MDNNSTPGGLKPDSNPSRPFTSNNPAAEMQPTARFQTEEEKVKAELDAKLARGEINGIEYNRQLIDLRLPDREEYRVSTPRRSIRTSELMILAFVIVSVILVAFFTNKAIETEKSNIANTLTASGVPNYSNSRTSSISSAPIQVNYSRPFLENGKYKGDKISIYYKAYYDITGVVTSVRDYYGPDAYDTLVPRDVCIAWGSASTEYKTGKGIFRQGERYCSGRVSVGLADGWSNNHPIPSSGEIYDTIMSLTPGNEVRLTGYLVKVEYRGISLDSSMVRDDLGCEVIYVTHAEKK